MARSIKLMAKVNNLITFLKLLSIVFIVIVGVAGIIIRRGVWKEGECDRTGIHLYCIAGNF